MYARWGDTRYKYGDSNRLYGEPGSPQGPPLVWTFMVAWDGSFSGIPGTFNNEAMRMVDLTVRRGRDHYLKSGEGGFAHYDPGEAVALFDNEDGRYDPWNEDSPLYPYVKPGKFVRIKVLDDDEGDNYSVMYGTITDIQPIMYNGTPHARITIKDGLQWLADANASVGKRTALDVKFAVGYILDLYEEIDPSDTKWPEDEWAYYYGGDSLDNEKDYWWCWGQNALEAIHEIEDAEMATFFHTRTGYAALRGRDYTYLRTKAVDESELLRDYAVPQPWDIMKNKVRIYAHPLVLDEDGPYTVWELGEILPIANGETIHMEAIFQYEGFSLCGSGTGYSKTVNTDAGGAGADISANCDVEVDGGVGEGVIFDITNNSGSDGYILSLYFTSDLIYSPYELVRESYDEDSMEEYGQKSLIIDSRWLNSTDFAKDLANWLLERLSEPSPLPTIQVENRPGIQFYLDLYDRMELTMGTLSIDEVFRVGKVEHRWLNPTGNAVRTVFKLEPYLQAQEDYWTFPTLIGETSILGL